MKRFIVGVVVALVISTGCASAPPNLSPAAHAAFNSTRVIKTLDLIRNTAEAAEVEGLFSRNSTRAVVQYHQSAVKVIDATRTGWQSAVTVGLEETIKALPEAERTLLLPYAALARALIAETR